MSHLMNTYKRLPVAFERGEGCWLWDKQGNRYLDALAGIAVCGVGHSHPRLIEAITAQAGKLIHTSNLYEIENQEKLADRLAAISGMERYFSATRAAKRTKRRSKLRALRPQKGHRDAGDYRHGKSVPRPYIATLSATGSRKVQAGFEPLVPGFVRVPFDDLAAVRRVAAKQSQCRRRDGRAHSGRRRHQYLPRRLPSRPARNLRCERLAADARRSPKRHRTHRQVVRVSAFAA